LTKYGNKNMKLDEMKAKGLAPEGLTTEGLKTLEGGYLLEGETPKDMYRRVAQGAVKYLNKPEIEQPLFDAMWKNWICPASPLLSNFNTDRGLPISCYGLDVKDSLAGILDKNHELGMLSKYGGGVGMYLGHLRGRGTQVKGTGGTSSGVVSWAKIYDSTILSCNQGGVRRGAAAVYLDVDHPDFYEFAEMRRTTGDPNTRCLNLHHGICLSEEFMQSLEQGHKGNRDKWGRLLTLRMETGEPYFAWPDTANTKAPQWVKDQELKLLAPQLCNEIWLPSDADHTYVCCLSSMNLSKWHEWKNTDAVKLAIYLLDAVITEFLIKAKDLPGLRPAVNFAKKSRALGLGALGWHTLLQENMIPFDSFESMMLNSQIFKSINSKSMEASKELATEFGEPEWCKGYGVRNLTVNAVAPTTSNSLISGGVSQGIEPVISNGYVQNSAKGTFIRKNKTLENFLDSKGKNTEDTWKQITQDKGSVLNLSFMTEDEKKVFYTAREINQFAIIKQAGQRQQWIDQGQSVNLFFGVNADPKYIHNVHLEAWKSGLKGLYYLRTESVLRADLASRSKDECEACSG
jgi:ribonucleoside-diphosphate reductase alpha chain